MTATGIAQTQHDPPVTGELLEVEDLRVSFSRPGRGEVVPVESVSFGVGRGQRAAIVGESGSGKSLTAMAVLGLVPSLGGTVDTASSVAFDGEQVLAMPEHRLRLLRGGQIGMVFQDPLAALDPVHTIGYQLGETLKIHRGELSSHERAERAVDLLRDVQLRRPERLLRAYPHELSGGMRQRVMIAMALAGEPDLLIADEPTTALDVTVQARILDLIYELSETRGLAVLLITHDLSIVAGFADHVIVMYGGRDVERAPTDELFRRPRHPYSAALLQSLPPSDRPIGRLTAIPGSPPHPGARPNGCSFHPRCAHATELCAAVRPELVPPGGSGPVLAACHRSDELVLEPTAVDQSDAARPKVRREASDEAIVVVRDLGKTYRTRLGFRKVEELHALAEVSIDIRRGEALGIVGESGSGKSTLARCLLRFATPTTGSIVVRGEDLVPMRRRELRRFRRDVQMIFQDPSSSLDPRLSVGRALAEPLRVHGLWGRPGFDRQWLLELLDLVQLPADSLRRYPHQFSGGQLQRIAIARALALRPALLVCDEPVASLDVSVRSSVLNLLVDLRDQLDLTLVFIAHDLSLVRFLCDRVGVMWAGRLVELQPVEQLFTSPRHEHTKELLAAQPSPDPALERMRRAQRSAAPSATEEP